MFIPVESPYFPIKGLLDDHGIVKNRPSKRANQLLVLAYIAENLPGEFNITEAEFNALLKPLHHFDDVALLRRELYIQEYIDREKDGSRYWRQNVFIQ